MLGAAAPKPQWQYDWAPLPVTEAAPDKKAHDRPAYENNPIWRFDSPTFAGAGVQVKNVTCQVRPMNYMKMPVLDLVEWGPVTLRPNEGGGDVSLPLTTRYLLRSRYVKSGVIQASTSGYWQLPANVDQSFEMVFGYEIPFANQVSSGPHDDDPPDPPSQFPVLVRVLPPLADFITPLSTADISSDQLMENGLAAVSHTDPGTQSVSTLRPPPLRIVIVVSLVCCKERYDFDPFNVLGAGRLYPLLMIMVNYPLNRVAGAVKLSRPSRTMHTQIEGETMTANIGSALFADRNSMGVVVRPIWSNIFDYYWLDPPADRYKIVTPSDRGSQRTIVDGVTVNERSSILGVEDSSNRDVVKLAGQGEFDNIHMAPKMVADKVVLEQNDDLTGLDSVTMAPFCVHDCFHMHWRWSNSFGDRANKGWAGQNPYAAAGAPLVPGNQDVTLEMLSPASFRYAAIAENPNAGEWQIIMHHGGGYAIDYTAGADAARQVVLANSASNEVYIKEGGRSPWTTFYWWLRYDRSAWRKRQFERLTWTPQQFAALREVASKTAAR